MVRLFIALPIPEEVKQSLTEPQKQLSVRGIKPVEPENLHITLKFLGEAPEERIEEITSALDGVDEEEFDMRARGMGAFPNIRNPRVVWAGINEGEEESTRLARQVEESMSTLGFERERRSFTPHITLARVKSRTPESRRAVQNTVEEYDEHEFGEWRAKRVVLMQSKLTPKGPIYSERGEKKL